MCLPDVVAQSTESEASFSSPVKDVRTGCPDTPSETLVRLTIGENTPSWELKKWTVLPPIFLSYGKAFIVFGALSHLC